MFEGAPAWTCLVYIPHQGRDFGGAQVSGLSSNFKRESGLEADGGFIGVGV